LVQKSNYSKIIQSTILAKDVVNGINEYLEVNDIDLLAMTTHTKSLFERLFHKSITCQMLLHTHTPSFSF
jgi:nucleotide-binding universal stress UspA family protein